MDDIGAICFECKRQDFLPFQCKHCGMQFCIEHRYPDQHGCCSVTNQKCRKVIKKNHLLRIIKHVRNVINLFF